MLLGKPPEGIFSNKRNIFPAFSQGWNVDFDHIQPVIKILPEFPLADHLFENPRGRTNETCVDGCCVAPAEGFETVLLQRPQELVLKASAQSADFVKKQPSRDSDRKQAVRSRTKRVCEDKPIAA